MGGDGGLSRGRGGGEGVEICVQVKVGVGFEVRVGIEDWDRTWGIHIMEKEKRKERRRG